MWCLYSTLLKETIPAISFYLQNAHHITHRKSPTFMGNALHHTEFGWRMDEVIQIPTAQYITQYTLLFCSGARPTNVILIEFEMQWNFVMPSSIIYSTDHNEIMHTSIQWIWVKATSSKPQKLQKCRNRVHNFWGTLDLQTRLLHLHVV